MQKVEKGNWGYLAYKKKINCIIMACAFLIVLAVFFGGIIVTGNRNNVATVIAIILVLPAAKFAVAYLCLLPHKSATAQLKAKLDESKKELTVLYDLIISNSKSPIGTLAIVISADTVIALTGEEKADCSLFETSVTEFLKNDKLKCNVTLYKDEKTFLKRLSLLSSSYDNTEENKKKMEYVAESMLNMSL